MRRDGGSLSMIGQTLEHYRIIEKIGEGGMGVVYRAHDERLDRDVALKVLPDSMLKDAAALKSFHKEAHALSRLSHPNIATVHDFGTQEGVTFLVMELIPGVTLDQKLAAGPLTEKEVLRLGTQLAQGLTAAHKEHLVHRDLKPSNLRITPDGRLKILDFGLAKFVRAEQLDLTQSITETHQVAGTVPYMSPEQLQGEPADARSDIYSAGAVLYEMITDRRPFPEKYTPLLIDSILHKAPQPPGSINHKMSPELESVILKALDKDPDHRYQSAKELGVDIERIGSISASPPLPQKSRRNLLPVVAPLLVILISIGLLAKALAPFVSNYIFPPHHVPGIPSPDDGKYLAVFIEARSDLQPLARQLSRELSVKLMAIKELSVASPYGTERVLNETVAATPQAENCGPLKNTIDKAACQIFVNLILHGALQRDSKGKISIDVSLDDIAKGRTKLLGPFQGNTTEAFEIEDKICERIRKTMKIEVNPDDRLQSMVQLTDNPDATALFNQGDDAMEHQSDVGSLNTAIGLFESAIQKNPTLARAYVGLASANFAMWKATRREDFLTRATEAARKAQKHSRYLTFKELKSLTDVFIEGHDPHGTEYARELLSYALQVNPDDGEVWRNLGKIALRDGSSKTKVLFYYFNATHIVPESDFTWSELGSAYYHFGDWKNAGVAFNRAVEINPNKPEAFINRGQSYCSQGEYELCISDYNKALSRQREEKLLPNAYIYLSLGEAYIQRGRYAEAIHDDEMAVQTSPTNYLMVAGLADAYEANGELDKAQQNYKKATILAQNELDANPNDYSAFGDMARFYAKAKPPDPARARVYMGLAREHDPYNVDLMYEQAQVLALINDEDRALDSLMEAFDAGYTTSAAVIDFDLRSLRSSRKSEFEKLVRDSDAKSK
jgi:serine/threonine protein kinase/tetratricopeptide (TPR) repeat protein